MHRYQEFEAKFNEKNFELVTSLGINYDNNNNNVDYLGKRHKRRKNT
jgi:hypothetical protein